MKGPVEAGEMSGGYDGRSSAARSPPLYEIKKVSTCNREDFPHYQFQQEGAKNS